ncbi:MAG: YcxB family protein [Flavobacteriales bacterium]
MIIKTKKYQLTHSKYIKLALGMLLRKEWWYGFGPLLLIGIGIIADYFWTFLIIALVIAIGYILFWLIQFAGLTQHEMGKVMFYNVSYDIDSKQIIMKFDAQRGMPMQWNGIKKVVKTKDAFILSFSKAQFFHLPFDIFRSQNDLKLMETIISRKNLL